VIAPPPVGADSDDWRTVMTTGGVKAPASVPARLNEHELLIEDDEIVEVEDDDIIELP
jgi:hypothetical protein